MALVKAGDAIMKKLLGTLASAAMGVMMIQAAGATEVNDAENLLYLDLDGGRVVIQMLPEKAPHHVARIKELAHDGFYDGIVFHRVIDGFMAQTGDPTGTGMGGSGKKLRAEFSKQSHNRGTVSMARSQDPNSGDSQFFICLADAPWLNNQYTVWGEVIEGMENVDKNKRGEPVKDPDKITRVSVGPSP
jgi:peptidylprolyl isomerase